MTLQASSVPEITVGDELAVRIKNVFYADVPWSMVLAKQIANKMKQLKKLGEVFYPELDILQRIRLIAQYDDKTLRESMDLS